MPFLLDGPLQSSEQRIVAARFVPPVEPGRVGSARSARFWRGRVPIVAARGDQIWKQGTGRRLKRRRPQSRAPAALDHPSVRLPHLRPGSGMLNGGGDKYAVRNEPHLESGEGSAGWQHPRTRPAEWGAHVSNSGARFRGHGHGEPWRAGQDAGDDKGPKRVPVRLIQTFAVIFVAGLVLLGFSIHVSSLMQAQHRVRARPLPPRAWGSPPAGHASLPPRHRHPHHPRG